MKPGSALLGAVGAAILSLAPAAPAGAEWKDELLEASEIGFDLVVLRPLNALALAVGGAFFAISAPLVAPFEDLDASFDTFVYAPYEYTFERELGDL